MQQTLPVIQGILPVLQMPFNEDESIDRDILAREIDHVFEAGADGVVLALASELLRLTRDERLDLSHEIPVWANGHGTVTISVGAETIRDAVTYAEAAEHAGADAVMAVPPLVTPLDSGRVMDYYRAIHNTVSIPLVVQDASGYTGTRPLSADLQARLRNELGERVYFKPEAQPVGPTLTRLQNALDGKAVVFEGSGGLNLIDSWRRGIAGTMPGSDLIRGIVEIWRALSEGDDARAYAVHFPLAALVQLQQPSLDTYLAVEKHLLVRQGVFRNTLLRSPSSCTLDEFTAAEVDRVYDLLMDVLG